MKANLIANIVNVMGNYILIYGKLGFPRLGVLGAALATNISRIVACVLVLHVFFSGRFVLRLSLKDSYRPDFELLGRVLRVGLPTAIEQFILRGGQLAYVRIVASFGTTVFAAHQIGMNILSLSFMPGQAFAIAATTLVGQELGAKRPDLAAASALETRRLGMLVSGIMALIFIFFGRWVAMLYTNDETVIGLTSMVLKVIGVVQPAQSTQFILAGGLRGAGDTKWPLYSTFMGIWGVRVLTVTFLLLSYIWAFLVPG
jgi:putative MATE family efflux protein